MHAVDDEGGAYQRTSDSRLPLRWMAPESIEVRAVAGMVATCAKRPRGPQGRHTAESDVYMFGMMILEAFSGDYPFKGVGLGAVLRCVLQCACLPTQRTALACTCV